MSVLLFTAGHYLNTNVLKALYLSASMYLINRIQVGFRKAYHPSELFEDTRVQNI